MSYSNKVYNLAENYTSDNEVTLTNANIKAAADSYFTLIKDAHDDDDLSSSNYNYYANLGSVLDNVTGLNLFPPALKAKIKSSGSRFLFKNTVDNKYIIVNDQRAFVFTNESDFDDIKQGYDWAQANNVYSGSQVTAQYNGALNQVGSNMPTQ